MKVKEVKDKKRKQKETCLDDVGKLTERCHGEIIRQEEIQEQGARNTERGWRGPVPGRSQSQSRSRPEGRLERRSASANS